MKYHERICKYRLQHKREPLTVFIDDYEYLDHRAVEEFNDPSFQPYVSIAGDFIQGLDLRFVYGLDVQGSSRCEKRAKALFKRLQMFKPRSCAVTVIDKQKIGQSWIGMYTNEQGVICE